MSALVSLNTLVILGMVISAVLAVVFEKPLSSVIALAVTGGFAALEFMLLNAADVAISEAAVGAVLTTAIYIIAINKTTKKEDEEK